MIASYSAGIRRSIAALDHSAASLDTAGREAQIAHRLSQMATRKEGSSGINRRSTRRRDGRNRRGETQTEEIALPMGPRAFQHLRTCRHRYTRRGRELRNANALLARLSLDFFP